MEANLLLGYGFIVLAFLCTGTFALPSKFAKGYAWENTWGFSFSAQWSLFRPLRLFFC